MKIIQGVPVLRNGTGNDDASYRAGMPIIQLKELVPDRVRYAQWKSTLGGKAVVKAAVDRVWEKTGKEI